MRTRRGVDLKWWTTKSNIPFDDRIFNEIIKSFVFECPSVTRKRISNGLNNKGEKKYKEEIQEVSARTGVSFKSRGITGDKLNTILSKIKKPLVRTGSYLVINPDGNVELEVKKIIESSTLTDTNFELIVMKDRYEMPKTEAVFYYIRNAFAHGSFEVKKIGKESVYLIESARGGDIKARMRLKEATLLEYIKLSKSTKKEIKALQKTRKK
jgi:hypothetical protein